MANISIKDVPDAWADALRQRAARNHRSLQGELMSIIEQAVGAAGAADRSHVAAGRQPTEYEKAHFTIVGYGAGGHPIMRQGSKSVRQIAAEIKAKYPTLVEGAPLAVDIIRAERDSR